VHLHRRAANSKGLRHFALKVCEQVRTRGVTSYSEVADALVVELGAEAGLSAEDGAPGDEKNIRRRVYDAINVLMALGVMKKERKAIVWHGLPGERAAGSERLRAERAERLASLAAKREQLRDMVDNQRALQFLLQRRRAGAPAASGEAAAGAAAGGGGLPLPMPFVLVQAHVSGSATVQVHVSDDMRHAQLDFRNCRFEVHDDVTVTRQLMAAAGRGGGGGGDDDDDDGSGGFAARAPAGRGRGGRGGGGRRAAAHAGPGSDEDGGPSGGRGSDGDGPSPGGRRCGRGGRGRGRSRGR